MEIEVIGLGKFRVKSLVLETIKEGVETVVASKEETVFAVSHDTPEPPPVTKKRGRPKGSKNKKKTESEQEKKEPKVPAPEQEKKEPEQEKEKEKPLDVDLRDTIMAVVANLGYDEAKRILEKYGAAKLSEVAEDDKKSLLMDAKKLLENTEGIL